MRRSTAQLALASLVLSFVPVRSGAGETASTPSLFGFGAASAAAERDLESRFDAELDARRIRATLERLAARPHHLGSPYGRENAEWMRGELASWGFDAKIEEFQVLFPTPKSRRLEMVAPTRFVARLDEPALAEDRTSGQKSEQLPTYNAYSIDGDVTGELVYVNYGVPEDYEELERRGISLVGKIAIARYGGSWRGIKPKVAAEHGAIGCIIYSDPAGDGYNQGDVWPKGGWRSEHSVQRGSVADMPVHSGDPLTPGVGATANAKRLKREEATTLTRIPVLPISAADALPLLAAMSGPMAPETWRGALAQPYHLGPGPAKVRLALAFDWKLATAYDVIATMRGSERPDEWIVRGNHHDAWVNGAMDPVSGIAALLEEARAVGMLAKAGFRPKRTLVYAGWDGEEQGLLGSTEWAETHAEELRAKAVVYINSDSNARGFFGMGGSHSLERLVNEAARDVVDPQRGVPVRERLRAAIELDDDADAAAEARDRDLIRLSPLGSGSDFTPFLQHLGIAALDIGFGGEENYGQYHSIYDSIDHYERFGDPEFAYGVALARVAGRIVLRLSQADRLPLDPALAAEAIARYAHEVAALADRLRGETEAFNSRVARGLFELVADPKQPFVAPKAKDPVPHLNFAPLANAVEKLSASAGALGTAIAQAESASGGLSPERSRHLDAALLRFERQLASDAGLPERPWYKHQIYAPGQYAGYGARTLPAIREALEQRSWQRAEDQVLAVATLLEGAAGYLDAARAAIER